MSKKPVFRNWRNQKLIFEERDPQKYHLHVITSLMIPKYFIQVKEFYPKVVPQEKK
jgi:hypothetical protein